MRMEERDERFCEGKKKKKSGKSMPSISNKQNNNTFPGAIL